MSGASRRSREQPLLKVVNADATPEEIAALVAVFASLGLGRGARAAAYARVAGQPPQAARRRTRTAPAAGAPADCRADPDAAADLLGWRRDHISRGRPPGRRLRRGVRRPRSDHRHRSRHRRPRPRAARPVARRASRPARRRLGAPVSRMRDTVPVDDREAVARDAFLERMGVDVETADAGYARADLSVAHSWAHAVREAFDLMPTDTEQAWDDIAGPAGRHPGRPGRLPDHAGRGGRPRTRGGEAAVRRGRRPDQPLDRPGREPAGTSSPTSWPMRPRLVATS